MYIGIRKVASCMQCIMHKGNTESNTRKLQVLTDLITKSQEKEAITFSYPEFSLTGTCIPFSFLFFFLLNAHAFFYSYLQTIQFLIFMANQVDENLNQS